MVKASFLAVLMLGASFARATEYRAQYVEDEKGRRTLEFLDEIPGDAANLATELEETEYPRFIGEQHAELKGDKVVELRTADLSVIRGVLKARGVSTPKKRASRATDELTTLVNNGPSANRIDLVFMGDGYTQAEKGKFLADVKRLTDDIFNSDTFHSYLPLFNVHAVFRASVESGIGKNDRPKNTAYKLYRLGDTLRAIMPGDTAAATASCRKAPDCDFPILVANDPYYGGLGGQFAITTSSVASGSIVLRHELGHNFGRVGEEYDGGEATMFGANYSSSTSVSWSHWLTAGVDAKPEKAVSHFVGWPWKNLATGAFVTSFRSTGNWDKHAIRFSASGVDTDSDLDLTLDGAPIKVKSPGTPDRTFFDFVWSGGFSAGDHELKFAEGVADGNNWLSSLTVHEFDKDFHGDASYVGIYPSFTANNTLAGYRATNETCLMRNMASRHFCPICQENNWLKFFGKVTVVDDIKVTRPTVGRVAVQVVAPPLSPLEVRWTRDGKAVPALDDQLKWEKDEADAKGRWEASVRFTTSEVRKDPSGLLKAKKSVTI